MQKLLQTEEGRAAILVVGLTALISVLLLAFALPGVHSKPNHRPLVVAGPESVVDTLGGAL